MSGAAARGRIDKRRAILDTAFAVFAREGYAQAGVDVIAAEANVAKATVYSHFGDKENLLREAIAASADQALAENLAAVERLTDRGDHLRANLERVGLRLLQCYCDDRSWALRRLLSAEINQFPELLDIIHNRAADRITEALADRLARAALATHARTSIRTLSRKFHAETGLSPLQWLLHQRVLRAQELLETTDLPMDQVARLSGLATTDSLRLHLTRRTGLTPSAYRAAFTQHPRQWHTDTATT